MRLAFALLGLPLFSVVCSVTQPVLPLQGKTPAKQTPKKMTCQKAGCHADLTQDKFVHGPVAVQECVACHQVVSLEDHEFKVESSDTKLCGSCHESTATGKKHVHGPVAAGGCRICHSVHSAPQKFLLQKPAKELCLSCHEELDRSLKALPHSHRPVSEDCSKCHDAHASNHTMQLKDEPQALCLDCHKAKKTEIESATVFHEALTKADGCGNCHKTHASKFPKLLDKKVSDLCLTCHDETQKRKDGTLVAAIGQRIAGKRFLHGPIREGDCTSCHNPHGSKHFRLLRKDYPQKFYAPFDMQTYNLCFNCHEGRVFTTEKTTTLTRFRQGDRNLHFLHVNKKTKGRTCRACHATHASNLPKHMAEKVPFGGWEIPMNYKATETGGSCAPGCHKPQRYDWK